MDTIAAISTPLGESGIGVVRISGIKALKIADKIFRGKTKPSRTKSHRILHGKIITGKGTVIDECLLMIMRKPKTYTTEDTVEINIHGGIISLNKILETSLKSGARLAEPGEFTRRAFMAGRIDLIQAEAVLDIIQAKSEKSLKMAVEQLDGKLSNYIKELKDRMLELLSILEIDIDFPEENLITKSIKPSLQKIEKILHFLIQSGEQGKLLKEGIAFTIVGQANVGKSSIFNSLIGTDRAIVTEIPGTTRDTIECWLNVNGAPVKLIDTAGFKEKNNLIDKKAQNKTEKAISEAYGILFIFDIRKGVTPKDVKLLDSLKDKKIIGIFNKCDLVKNKRIQNDFNFPCLLVSALKGNNINSIFKYIANSLQLNNIPPLVSKTRHLETLNKAKTFIVKTNKEIELLSTECIAYEIRQAVNSLSELTGEITNEAVLNKIFSEFCIGK